MAWIKDLIVRVDRHYNAIDRAKAAGTYNAMDRSRQYEAVTEKELIRQVNDAWTKIRSHEKTTATKDELEAIRKQLESRIWHRIVVIVAAAEFTLIVMLLEKYAK